MNKQELKKFCEDYAEKQGFLLQPDPIILDQLLEGLLNREKIYGARYCPCRRVTGDRGKEKDIICPCKFHKDEIKEVGHCKCSCSTCVCRLW